MAAAAGSASAEDVERAKALVGAGERIIAVWTATPEQANNLALQIFSIGICPCFWPHMIILSPCLVFGYTEQKNILEHTMVILTDKKVYRQVDYDGACCCSNFKSGEISLNDVHSVSEGQSAPGTIQVTCCCQLPPMITLGLPPGAALAHAGGTKHAPHNKMLIIVNDEAEAVRLVREAKDAAVQQWMPMQQMQYGVPGAIPVGPVDVMPVMEVNTPPIPAIVTSRPCAAAWRLQQVLTASCPTPDSPPSRRCPCSPWKLRAMAGASTWPRSSPSLRT